jgi:osmotically-inducible protein OsmY
MKRLYLLLTLTIALVLGSAAFAADKVSDDALYDQVRIRIATDREVGGGNIEVKVTNGVVELTGNVPDDKHKQRVEKVVKKVKGVKSVENKLRISPA